ncbi:excalibur calcium-binding domain-containing protein [Asticcacaulis sp. BE141]|uniref:excalibur calcium-binding domain-containing protein n=1 Tax=Asticcacaulis TaxID=76890 RepID=UPI003857813E
MVGTVVWIGANVSERSGAQAGYATCGEARKDGATPLYSWEAKYRVGLDRDGNGVACEPGGKG